MDKKEKDKMDEDEDTVTESESSKSDGKDEKDKEETKQDKKKLATGKKIKLESILKDFNPPIVDKELFATMNVEVKVPFIELTIGLGLVTTTEKTNHGKKALVKFAKQWKKERTKLKKKKVTPPKVTFNWKVRTHLFQDYDTLQKKLAYRQAAKKKKLETKKRCFAKRKMKQNAKMANLLLGESGPNVHWLMNNASSRHVSEWLKEEALKAELPLEIKKEIEKMQGMFVINATPWRELALPLMKDRYPHLFDEKGNPITKSKKNKKKKPNPQT